MCARNPSENQRVGGLLQRTRDETVAAEHAPVLRARDNTEGRSVFLAVTSHVHELRAFGAGHARRLYVRTQRTSQYI